MYTKKLSLVTIALLVLAAPASLEGRGGAAIGAGLGGFALGGLIGGSIHNHDERRSSRKEEVYNSEIRENEALINSLREERQELKAELRDLKNELRELKRENKKLKEKIDKERSRKTEKVQDAGTKK